MGDDDRAIEELLAAYATSITKLTPTSVRDTWRAWKEAYPLPPKQPHAILQDTVIHRLAAVSRSLAAKHALAAYYGQTPGEVVVLTVDSLVGWECTCRAMPPVDELDINVLVTARGFAWTFGSSQLWRRRTLYGGPVFLERANL